MSKRFTLTLALLVLATRAFCWSKQIDFDCAEMAPGASQSYLQDFLVKNKFATQIAVSAEASNLGTAEAPKCHVKWTVTGKLAGRSRVLFRREDDPGYTINGIMFDGTSPDGSKLLLDFFSAEGDHTVHSPVVYDFSTSTWLMRHVEDRVTRNLPKCDYFTMIQGVTNEGDVVLYVPKSFSVDSGCPDQGEWLLHMKTDTITRVDEANAPSQTQSPR